MAAAQPARFGAHGDDIADWMAQRWRDIANLGPEAGDAGRRLWAEATRSGQNLSAANPSDVYALGAQYLSGRTAALGAPQQVDPSQSYAPDPSGNSAGGDDWSNPLGQGGLFQLAAAPGKGFWDYWGVPGCRNCHGYTPDTLPPYSGPFPFHPDYSQRKGSSGSSSRPEWSDRPECNEQFETDRKICQKAGSPLCWENSNKRLGICNSTGKVGVPELKFGGR